ncbi:MAG: hypothetical protein HC804_03710 [Anaerolineae bacterium]|nr:hypothetical protein [Anaerolineae bacterium]
MYRTRPDIASPPGEETAKDLPTEVPARMHTVEAVAEWLRLALNGASGKWTLHATNESDVEMNRVSVVYGRRPTSPSPLTLFNWASSNPGKPGKARLLSSYAPTRQPSQTLVSCHLK